MKEYQYQIEKPDLSKYFDGTPHAANSKWDFVMGVGQLKDKYSQEFDKVNSQQYLHWQEIKNKDWVPDLPKEKFWASIKLERSLESRKTPILDEKGNYFSFLKANWHDKFLHDVTRDMSGSELGRFTEHEKVRYIHSSLMEEAIASSQLEGASTTRARAKEMIIRKLPPKDKAEQMILNNYHMMMRIESEFKSKPMSLDLLLEMHEIITKDTLKNPDESGRLRKPEDKIVIEPRADKPGMIIYTAPDIEFVKGELVKLVQFANDDPALKDEWRHPVIKAIMLHFWIGFLHPFADGNGRLARSLFYWYLLKNGYYNFALSPITTLIKRAPTKYWMAFVYSEQDDNDLTYFVDYHMRLIRDAQAEFSAYVDRKIAENKKVSVVAQKKHLLNDRQMEVLKYFRNNENEKTDVIAHMSVFNISRLTAIDDLKKLEQKGFLQSAMISKRRVYFPTEKIREAF